MWKFAPALGAAAAARQEPEDKWRLQPPSRVQGAVTQLAVSGGREGRRGGERGWRGSRYHSVSREL